MIELYQFWDSPCCMKVRMTLAEKGLDWTLRPITTYKFDHYQPSYQALNPHSLVPTLVHDGNVVIQSGVIAEYLDDAFPDPPLKPAAPRDRAKVREWMREEEEFLFRLVVTMSFNIMMKLRAKAYGMAQLQAWSKRHPDRERAEDYLRRVTSPADLEAVAQAEKKFRWHMERLERQLAATGGPWVVGSQFTLADICLAPILDRIEYLAKEHLWDGLPRVARWYARVKERPSFRKAAPSFDDRMWGPKKPVAAPAAVSE
jgi:glutathione S-transferase